MHWWQAAATITGVLAGATVVFSAFARWVINPASRRLHVRTVAEVTAIVQQLLAPIRAEMSENGGTSIKDRVVQQGFHLTRQDEHLDRQDRELSHMDSRLDVDLRRLDRVEVELGAFRERSRQVWDGMERRLEHLEEERRAGGQVAG